MNKMKTKWSFFYNVNGDYTPLRSKKDLETAIDYLDEICKEYHISYRLNYKTTKSYTVNWYTRDGNNYISPRKVGYLPVWIQQQKSPSL